MENAEEILQCLDEFSKLKPKDIPRELEDYLCFVAKTGDPVYQWPLIKCLFREKLISVITEFYETCPSVEIPPCPNVDAFNYDAMKLFILDKLDTFAAAPFTVQRICELLTSPRKEYNRIDKYMRALEKNILVVSTREPGNRKSTENGESIVNGLESEHISEINSDINVEVEMDETASVWAKTTDPTVIILDTQTAPDTIQDTFVSESKSEPAPCGSSIETVITTRPLNYIGYTPNITDLIIEPSTTEPDEPSEPPVDSSVNVFAMATEPIIPTEPPEIAKDNSEAEPAFPVSIETEPTLVQIEPLVRNTEPESTDNLIIDTETDKLVEPIVTSVLETFPPIPTVVQSLVEATQTIREPIVQALAATVEPVEPIVETVEAKSEPVETMVEPEITPVQTVQPEQTVDILIQPEIKTVQTIVETVPIVELVEKIVEPVLEIIETIEEPIVQVVEPIQEPKIVEPVEELVQPLQIVESTVEAVEPVAQEVMQETVVDIQTQEIESAAAQIESSILNTSEAVTEMTISSTEDFKSSPESATQPELAKIESVVVESTVPDDVDSLPAIEPKVVLEPTEDEGMEVDESPEQEVTQSLTDIKVEPTGDLAEVAKEN